MINDENERIENYEEERWFKNMELGPVGKRLLDDLIREQMSQNKARVNKPLQNEERDNEPLQNEGKFNYPL